MISYEAIGFMIATDWYGQVGYMPVHLRDLSDEDIKSIVEDPLQDYTAYSFQKINYVGLYIYKHETQQLDNRLIEVTYLQPENVIKAGNIPEGFVIPEEVYIQ